MALHFVLIAETPLVHAGDLFRLAAALERNAADCASIWQVERPAIDVIDDRTKLPPNCHPIAFVDSDDDPGALAEHWSDYTGPLARAFVNRASGLNSGQYSVSEAAAHEVLEALIDPDCDKWVKHPDPERAAAGVEVALEVCDPCQDSYVIEVDGTGWQVANFVTPKWFGLPGSDEHRFDYRGEMSRAGEVGPEGYLVLRAPDVNGGGFVTWFESRVGPQMASHRAASVRHPWSRSRKRGVVL